MVGEIRDRKFLTFLVKNTGVNYLFFLISIFIIVIIVIIVVLLVSLVREAKKNVFGNNPFEC